jgi:hypothetical protein
MLNLNPPRRAVGGSTSDPRMTMELANSPAAGLGLPSGTQSSNIVAPAMMMNLMDGFLVDNPMLMNKLFRDIYAYDVTVGSVIDLLSTLSLGDFDLTGMADERRLQKFAQAIENMRVRQLLPSLSIDYLTLGLFIATTKWDESKTNFVSLSPQSVDMCDIQPVPIYGAEPIVSLAIPQAVVALLTSGRPEMERFKKLVPDEFLTGQSRAVQLDSRNLIYIARPGQTADYRGVSLIKRCLPVCLMERALIRGTMDLFWKRQRSTLHIQAGDDQWNPSREDFASLASLFMAADHDPNGAVIATRRGIDVNLIDRATEGLKYPDIYDFAQQAKLRALGLSESLYGLDASIGVQEGSINIALKGFEAYRHHISRELFYRGIFPAIAVANGYKKQQSVVLSSGAHSDVDEDLFRRVRPDPMQQGMYRAEFAASMPNDLEEMDLTKFAMPKVEWHTNLEPRESTSRMDMLQRLADQGLPIPLRMWAAAGGVSLKTLVEQRDADVKARKWMQDWRKLIAKDKAITDGTAPTEEEEESSSTRLPGTGGVDKKNLLDRKQDPDFSVPFIEVGGKMRPRSRTERQRINDKANKEINAATATVVKHHIKTKNDKRRETAKRKFYHSGLKK